VARLAWLEANCELMGACLSVEIKLDARSTLVKTNELAVVGGPA
jgi:hypothetical protein